MTHKPPFPAIFGQKVFKYRGHVGRAGAVKGDRAQLTQPPGRFKTRIKRIGDPDPPHPEPGYTQIKLILSRFFEIWIFFILKIKVKFSDKTL